MTDKEGKTTLPFHIAMHLPNIGFLYYQFHFREDQSYRVSKNI
jgi:hypothetical protein